MNIGALIGALAFGTLGFVLCGVLIFYILRAIFPALRRGGLSIDPGSISERWMFKKRKAFLQKSSSPTIADNPEQQLLTVMDSFYLGHVASSIDLLEEIRRHNIEALGRLLTLSKERGSRISALPELEDLFEERIRLMQLYLDSSLLRDKIREKYRREKKDGGAWSSEEYDKQIAELKREIERNRAELVQELKGAYVQIKSGKGNDGVTYH